MGEMDHALGAGLGVVVGVVPEMSVTDKARSSEAKIGITATTLWLTGLSASGKSTLAQGVADQLAAEGIPHKVIDGDELRTGLCADLGYTRTDRSENIRRAAEVCRILNSAGVIAIAALISPYINDRAAARQIIGGAAFKEVWVATSLAICEKRDPKGLYQKARAGLIKEFTGISDPYEPPVEADLVLNTEQRSISECVERINQLLNGVTV